LVSSEHSASDGEVVDVDDHVKLYGKKADELKYSDEFCPLCNTRIDERGWCGCGTIGGG
jgi:hypothetical protein